MTIPWGNQGWAVYTPSNRTCCHIRNSMTFYGMLILSQTVHLFKFYEKNVTKNLSIFSIISHFPPPPPPTLFAQVKSEMREERSGLGSKHSARSDEVGDSSYKKSRRLQKRYHEVVERDKLKKQRLDSENKQ